MGSGTSTLINTQQEIVNDMLFESSLVCESQCTNEQRNNIIVVSGKAGNITLEQSCAASTAGCVLNTTLEGTIQSILESITEQSQENIHSIMSFQVNVSESEANILQSIENKVSQIVSVSCSASASNIQENNVVYVPGTAGDITFTQNGDSIATCALSNLAKIAVFNDQLADSSQDSIQASGLIGIFASIGGIILILVGAFIILWFASSALSTVGKTFDSGQIPEGAFTPPASPVLSTSGIELTSLAKNAASNIELSDLTGFAKSARNMLR